MFAIAFALLCQIPLPPVMPVALETPAMQVAELPAPAVDSLPAAGVLTSPAAFVARVPTRSQCASGQCQQPASVPRQYVPQRRSRGVLFRNAPWNR
jgi:hypothetical protein